MQSLFDCSIGFKSIDFILFSCTISCFNQPEKVIVLASIKIFPAIKWLCIARSIFKSLGLFSSNNFLRPTWILEISIPMHWDNFDKNHICIFHNFSSNVFLSGLCCSYKSKKEWCLKRIATVRQFGIWSFWMDNKSWLNKAHAPPITEKQSL